MPSSSDDSTPNSPRTGVAKVDFLCYTNWSDFMEMLAKDEWVRIEGFRNWLAKCKTVRFYVKHVREALLTEYLQLPRVENLFKKDKRFPSGFYVQLNGSLLGDRVHAILSSCDLPNDFMNKEYTNNDVNDPRRVFDIAVHEAIEMVFSDIPKTLQDAGVLNTMLFESKTGLIWGNAADPPTKISTRIRI